MILAAVGMLIIVTSSLLSTKNNLLEDRKIKTRHVVETAYSILSHYNNQFKAGIITKEVAQQLAKDTIKSLRYEDKDYFWINDMHPNMIMHPIKPALDGKDLTKSRILMVSFYLLHLLKKLRKTDKVLLIICGLNLVMTNLLRNFHM